MFYVIRNGEYLESEKLLFGDIKVPKKPHNNSVFKNGGWILDVDSYFLELDKNEAHEFLNNTDWKILRHREQQDLGIETTLNEEEYKNLITQRQERRIILNDITE